RIRFRAKTITPPKSELGRGPGNPHGGWVFSRCSPSGDSFYQLSASVSAAERAVNDGAQPHPTRSADDVSKRLAFRGCVAARSRAAEHGLAIQYRRTRRTCAQDSRN